MTLAINQLFPEHAWEPGCLLVIVQSPSCRTGAPIWNVKDRIIYSNDDVDVKIPLGSLVVFFEFDCGLFAYGGVKVLYGEKIGWVDKRSVELPCLPF